MKYLKVCISSLILLLMSASLAYAIELSLNQSRFIPGETLALTLNEDWSGEADVYVAVTLPGDDAFFFLTPPLNFGLDFVPYAVATRASGSNEILRIDLPAELPTREYTFYAAAMRVTGFVDEVIGKVVQASFIFAIDAEPVVLIFGDTRLPDGVIGRSYRFAIEPETGTPPYQFSLISGTLPDGLTLGSESGLIQGEPTERSVAQFTVQVVDVSGNVGEIKETIKIFNLLSFGEHGTYKGCDDLQVAFDSTQDLDDIRIEQGTYECNGLSISSSKTFEHGIKVSGGWDSGFVNQSDDPAVTVFDGQKKNILYVSAKGPVVIKGLSFQNGQTSGDGGAIYGKVNITHCVFTDNSASRGGAVSGADTITNSTFTNNSASRGGAVSGADTITKSTFTNNSASENGGAVYSSSSSDFSSSISNSTFTNNRASENGGAVYSSSYSDSSSISNSTFTNNRASKNGGAVYSDYSSFYDYSITNSTFTNNSASENGGAVYGADTITNSTFTNNSASENGGAVFDAGTIITNSTFTNNSASYGGAVSSSSYISSSKSTIINCTFTNNSVSNNGGGFYGGGTIQNTIFSQNKVGEKANDITPNGNLHVDYTLVNDISDEDAVDLGTHIIKGDPRFVDAENENFRLRADSPAIDVGDSSVIESYHFVLDLDGKPRIIDGNPRFIDGNPHIIGGVIDLGAYEVQ